MIALWLAQMSVRTRAIRVWWPPLALAFADHGLRVLGIDNDPERLGAVRERRMPFEEPGAQVLGRSFVREFGMINNP